MSYTQSADEVRPYSVRFVLPSGETVASAAWRVLSGGSGLVVAPVGVVGSLATAQVSGGTGGTSYVVRCQVTTSAGNKYDGDHAIAIVE